jgi:hypothetical protein
MNGSSPFSAHTIPTQAPKHPPIANGNKIYENLDKGRNDTSPKRNVVT